MKPNISLQIEQEQRERNDYAALEAQIDESDIYAEGEFDGAIGIDPNPEHWSNLSYRSGFFDGMARYYDTKYKVTIDQPF